MSFDSGRSKQKLLEPGSGMSKFEVGWISKASSEQRAGRAGRTGPGHCYRCAISTKGRNKKKAMHLQDINKGQYKIFVFQSLFLALAFLWRCIAGRFFCISATNLTDAPDSTASLEIMRASQSPTCPLQLPYLEDTLYHSSSTVAILGHTEVSCDLAPTQAVFLCCLQ